MKPARLPMCHSLIFRKGICSAIPDRTGIRPGIPSGDSVYRDKAAEDTHHYIEGCDGRVTENRQVQNLPPGHDSQRDEGIESGQ